MKKDHLTQILEDISISAQKDNIEETSKSISEMTEKKYGSVPFVIKMLKMRPDVCIPTISKSLSLYDNKEVLDPKTSELIAISSAVANRGEFCMNAHMRKALSLGATMEEILHTILISSAICETTAWGLALREFQKLQEEKDIGNE